MRASLAIAAAGLAAGLAGCGPRTVTVVPVDATDRLDAANALLEAGCYSCLAEALAEFDRIAALPGPAPASTAAAAVGRIQAATLLDLRQRELGMLDEGYLRRAQDVLAAHPELAATLGEQVRMLDSVAWRVPGAPGVSDGDRARAAREARQNHDAWTAALRATAGAEAFSAYAWLAYACSTSRIPRSDPDEVRALYAPTDAYGETGLVRYKKAVCPIVAPSTLEGLLADDPRFVEIDYYLSLGSSLAGRLDEADAFLANAYAWHPRWPAVTLARADLAVAAEDFAKALAQYDETLTLLPGQRDARLGRIRTLSYLGRHEEAIAAADDVLRGEWYRGEAFYWRAWNETQLEREAAAWADIDQAWRLYINGDVAKLYGILALHRHDLEKAQTMFEEGIRLQRDDCENPYYLGLVHAERRNWPTTADIFSATATCLDAARAALRAEIARLATDGIPDARQARQIASRERRYEVAGRMLATSWFNVAVASFNLARPDAARVFAEKVADDEQYGERARDILSRLEP